MLITVKILFCSILLLIAYSDFRFRCIPVYSLVAAFTAGIIILSLENTFKVGIVKLAFNFCIVTVQIIFVTIYFSLKHKRIINIFNSFLGAGDVIFLYVTSLCFSPVNLMIFLILSESLVIMLYFPFRHKKASIPLAGFMSLMLLTLIISDIITCKLHFYSDLNLIEKLIF